MEVNLNIDPIQIERHVSEAVLRSAIGTSLKQAIEKVCTDMGSPYNQAVASVVQQEIARILKDLIEQEYADRIKEAVKAKITEDVLNEWVLASWNNFLTALEKVRKGDRWS